ncbi:MAG: glycoside hydrolase family 5 protein [Robiginitomaculum sp.]|nr:glycoside hydrolase family 5 protein [Robiginitomaculum sp.]
MRIILFILLGIIGCKPVIAPAQVADFPARKCINMANALNAPTEGDWGYVIKEQHIEAIAKAGFDSIRIPIAWSQHTAKQAPYTIDPKFFARVDEVVTQALDNDLMIIIDVHNYEELDKNPSVETPRMRAIWQQIAWHYANAPDAVVFELLNEPMDKMSGKRWETLMRVLITDIRKTNPNRWIIVGGDNWNSIDGLAKLEAPYDKRLVLTYHDYDPYDFTHQGASWFADAPPIGTEWGSAKQRENLAATVAKAASIQRHTGMPVWLGEFGVHKTAPAASRIKWITAMREATEANDIGWCVFDFAAEFAFWSPQTEQWNQPLLDTLLGDNFQLRK